jgi:hypothetical protein
MAERSPRALVRLCGAEARAAHFAPPTALPRQTRDSEVFLTPDLCPVVPRDPRREYMRARPCETVCRQTCRFGQHRDHSRIHVSLSTNKNAVWKAVAIPPWPTLAAAIWRLSTPRMQS